jgi:hypothetical protein
MWGVNPKLLCKKHLLGEHGEIHNVSQLGEVVEIEVQMFGSAVHFNRCTDVQTTTKPAILPNCC